MAGVLPPSEVLTRALRALAAVSDLASVPRGLASATGASAFLATIEGDRVTTFDGAGEPELSPELLDAVVDAGALRVDGDGLERFASDGWLAEGERSHLHVVHRASADGGLVLGLASSTPLPEETGLDGVLRAFASRASDLVDGAPEAWCEAVVHQAPAGLYRTDRLGSCLFVNEAWSRIAGLGLAEALGDGWARALHVDDRERVAREWAESMRTMGSFRSEFRFQGPSADVRWVLSEARPEREGETVVGWVGTITDITELRDAQDALREAQGRLDRAQRLETVGRLAGGVAHDFNNLLGVILGCTGTLERAIGPESPHGAEMRDIRQAAERAASLTGQLLAYGRRQTLEPRAVDLSGSLAGLERMLSHLLGEDRRLVLEIGDTSPAWLDENQLEQVVVSLITNARDAMPRGGTVTLRVESVTLEADAAQGNSAPGGEYVMLSVSDTGVGISPKNLERIFEPFFTTKGQREGTGLGLATVQGIVEQSGGRVAVRSQLGRGTTFDLCFPVSAVEPAARLPAQTRLPLSAALTPARILVVEDQPALRRIVCRTLAHANHEVFEARDATHALELAGEHAIDLLVTDVVMPEMSGVEVATILRERQPDLRVLFVSGYATERLERHGMGSFDDPFLPKPFTPDALLDAVEAALRESSE